MSLLNKHFWKFLLGFFTILAIGMVWLFGAEYYHYSSNQEKTEANQARIR